jgi:hypothetical protein
MGGDGKVLLDFGPPPGTDMATVDVSGQVGLVSASPASRHGSLAEASADHSVDEHLDRGARHQGRLRRRRHAAVYGRATGQQPLDGKFSVGWVWNT